MFEHNLVGSGKILSLFRELVNTRAYICVHPVIPEQLRAEICTQIIKLAQKTISKRLFLHLKS